MKTYLDCVPCFVRQAIDGSRIISNDPNLHEQAVREVLVMAASMDFDRTPPEMGQRVHAMLRAISSNPDPYRQIKSRFNELAMELYPQLKQRVACAANPLEMAVRLAIAGNIIDFGVTASVDPGHVNATIDHSLTGEFDQQLVEELAMAYAKAGKVLYIGDNAGEIVFDRVLIEQLGPEKITFAVRGGPIINDVTREDAEFVGLTDIVEVIDNGDNSPGTILERCSAGFIEHFTAADIIIAKGQGNYETLSDRNRGIFFLLKAKCPMIAHHLGCEVGKMIFKRTGR